MTRFARLRSKEVVIRKSAQINGCHGNAEIHMHTKFHLHAQHAYQVSPPCFAWFASLRSEEIVIGKSARGNFLSMVIMEMLKHTCVLSFTSMHCTVCKFER